MPESSAEQLARRVAGYPGEAFGFFKGGFAAAAALQESTRRQVLAEVIDNIRRGVRRLQGSALASVTGLSDRDSEQLASAYSLVIGLLADSSATPDEFVDAGKGKLFKDEHVEVAREVAAAICGARGEISSSIEKTQLAGQVLPSLSEFEATVDIRLKIVDGQVKLSVPVAVVHIDTDAGGQEIWIQLTRGDIDEVIKKLSECLDHMVIAENATSRIQQP